MSIKKQPLSGCFYDLDFRNTLCAVWLHFLGLRHNAFYFPSPFVRPRVVLSFLRLRSAGMGLGLSSKR